MRCTFDTLCDFALHVRKALDLDDSEAWVFARKQLELWERGVRDERLHDVCVWLFDNARW